LGPLGGLSTGQLNCCLPRMEEKREIYIYLKMLEKYSGDVSCDKQEAQLSQTGCTILHVVEYFAKPLKIIRYDSLEYRTYLSPY